MEVHDLSPLSVVVLSIIHNSLQCTTYCLGGIGPVKTCHTCELDLVAHFKSNSPPRGCAFTWVLPVHRTSVSTVRHSYPYPELLWVLYARTTIHGTSWSSVRCLYRYPNFCWFCKTFISPVPGPSVSSVHPEPQYPGYGYSTFCTRPELLRVMHTRATIPGTSGSSVRPPSYPYPESTNPTELKRALICLMLNA